jgi:hypothetical protein
VLLKTDVYRKTNKRGGGKKIETNASVLLEALEIFNSLALVPASHPRATEIPLLVEGGVGGL